MLVISRGQDPLLNILSVKSSPCSNVGYQQWWIMFGPPINLSDSKSFNIRIFLENYPFVFVLCIFSSLLDSPGEAVFHRARWNFTKQILIYWLKFQKVEAIMKSCRNTEVKTVLSDGQKVILRLTNFILQITSRK